MSDFHTTQWSLVLSAATSGTAGEAALARLCEAYWQPLYAYVRRRGHGPEEARDLTQEFFARLLEKNWLQGLEREGGRFRSFLLTALQRLLTSEYRRQTAEKRGGGTVLFSLDWEEAEGRYQLEPTTDETPERIFDRRWATTVLHRAYERLRVESTATGRETLFTALAGFLSTEPATGEYEALSPQLGLSRNAIAAAVKRLRTRYRDMIRREVAETLDDPTQADAEMRELLAVLRG